MTYKTPPSPFRYFIENSLLTHGIKPLFWQVTALFWVFTLCMLALLPAKLLFSEALPLTWWQVMWGHVLPTPLLMPLPSALWMLLLWLLGSLWLLSLALYTGVAAVGLQRWLSDVQRGRKPIRERGHTVILGWSAKGAELVKQLALWNPNASVPCVAILTDADANALQRNLYEKLPDRTKAKVLVRLGNSLDSDALRLVNVQEAKTVIVLADTEGNEADTTTLKRILALVNRPQYIQRQTNYHIVTELKGEANLQLARLIAGTRLTALNSHDITRRFMAQTALQPGLSSIYAELMAFEGMEIYFHREPALWGKTFRQAVFSFEDTLPIGVRKSKKNTISFHDPEPFLRAKERDIVINPPKDYRLEEGDSLILISPNSRAVRLGKQRDDLVEVEKIAQNAVPLHHPEKILLLGWSSAAIPLLNELDAYMAKGSELLAASSYPLAEKQVNALQASLKNLQFQYVEADLTRRDILGELKPNLYEHIILLSEKERFGEDVADSHSLIALVHLRDIAQERGATYNITTEMANARNQELAHLAQPDDFIVSDNIIGTLLAQISENPELHTVFEEFFDASGCEIRLRPVEEYVFVEKSVNFYTLVEAALQKHQVAIGYQRAQFVHDRAQNFGIFLNPKKRDTVVFQPGDRLIVIIE